MSKYVTLNVSFLTFLGLFSLSNNSFLGTFFAQSISIRTNLELYSHHKRNLSKSLHCLSTKLASEQMRFNLKAWLYGKTFLQWNRWHELDCKYWWLSVGFTGKSVCIIHSVRDTVTSKKLTKIFDHSALKFMVGWTLLILSMNDFNLFAPCSCKKNMSSMYLYIQILLLYSLPVILIFHYSFRVVFLTLLTIGGGGGGKKAP